VAGKWPAYQRMVSAPLDRRHTASGERLVKVSNEGKPAKTEMRVLERFPDATLIEAKPISGRTHQIRVHTQHIGHPILGDTKYQNDQSASRTSAIGLKRLFLHATAIQFEVNNQRYDLSCPLDPELESVLDKLRTERKG
jgi:23S rRNA pseudouridine955/2504/2580 synthase